MAILDRQRIVTLGDSCGCSLTAASVTGLTPARFEAMALTEYATAQAYASAAEAEAIGVVSTPLMDLLKSRITEIGKGEINERKIDRQSIILPYTLRRRRSNISNPTFRIVSGQANPNAGNTVGGIAYPAHAWDIVVDRGPSPYASAISNLEKSFLIGQYLYVENLDNTQAAGSRTAYTTAHKIINSVNVNATQARVTIVSNYTAAGFAALTAGQKAVLQPTFGVLSIGVNNVDDMESWCANERADLSASAIVDWHQTMRYTQCHNDVYDKTLKAILDGDINGFAKDFQYLSLKEQNRQQRMLFDQKWMNTIFYGQRINEKQEPETYNELPQVVDPEDGCVYGYKANLLGLRTLLANEGRVIDAAGGPLSLDLLFQLAYEIKRNREVRGETVTVVDFMTDRDTSRLINQVLLAHLQKTLGYNVTQFYQPGKVLDGTGVVRYKYNTYDIPEVGFQIAIFVDQFFDDRIRQFPVGSGGAEGAINFRSRGRSLWAIDWTDFDIGRIATNSVKREYKGKDYANVNPLFNCVITPNTKHYELRSQTDTVRLGDSQRHVMIENYSLECPTITSLSCFQSVS